MKIQKRNIIFIQTINLIKNILLFFKLEMTLSEKFENVTLSVRS